MAAFDAWAWVGLGVLVLAVAALATALVWVLRNGRRAWGFPLQRLAAANGWSYEENGPDRLLERFGRFGPLRPGRPKPGAFGQSEGPAEGHRVVRHVVTGRARHSHFHVFEYDWEVPEDRRRPDGPRVQRHSLCAFLMTESAPPLTLLRRDRGEDKVRGKAGDVSLDPRFDRRFRVVCMDHAFARRVLGPAMRRFLLRSRTDWEWKGRWLVLHWDGRLRERDVLLALRKTATFVDRLPKDLRPPVPAFRLDEPAKDAAPA